MPTVYTSDEFMQALHYTLYMTVQHGSADTVVRLMSVKYRKWRLGVLLLRNPLTIDFQNAD